MYFPRRGRATTGAVALCLLLAACAGQPGQTQSGPAAEQTSPVAPAARNREVQAPQTAAIPPDAAPERPALPALEPSELVGMTSDKISSLFGQPVFVRRDLPGEFWRYRGKSCVLELFFYPQNGKFQVNHIEMRNGNRPIIDKPACVTALRETAKH